MTPPHFPARATPVPTAGQRFKGGGWYFVLPIASVGFLAAVPFWHAASRLGRRELRKPALAYTAAGVYLAVLAALSPPPQADGTSGNETLSRIFAFSALIIIVAACIQLRSLRRAVYGGEGVVPVHADPVVARALGARARRAETRQLLARDPGLQRDLGIGRPDLNRGYDDGGLTDVNTAPAEVIMQVADIERGDAEAIVAGRTARGGSWYDMAELIDNVPLSPSAREQLQERAVF
jgi:hypothetical protein